MISFNPNFYIKYHNIALVNGKGKLVQFHYEFILIKFIW